MSNAAKSAEEIEDVLASIRRLVSGPATGPAKPQLPPSTDPGAERLVLTPALRVNDPDDPWATIAPTADAGPDAASALAGDAPAPADPAWGLEDRLADWGEISDSAAEAVEEAISEGHGEDAALPAPEAPMIRFSARRAQAVPPAVEPEFEPETGDADWPDAGADSALRELVMARAQSQPEETAAEAAPSPAPEADHDRRPADPEAGPAPDPEPDADLGQAPDEGAPDTGPSSLEEDHLWAEEPAPEVDAAAAADGHEDAMQDADDMIEDLGEAASPFSFPDTEDGILDEETLREIVAEVVRQELQGALGQRITRNVRKMVRREIRLALAAEELE